MSAIEEVHPPPVMSLFEEEPDEEEEDENEDDDDDDDEDEDREEEVDSEEDDDGDGEEDGNGDEEDEEDQEEEVSTDVPTTAPLYLVYQYGRRKCRQSFFSVSEGIHFVKSAPEMNGMICCASCEGWLVILDIDDSRRCFLFNPVSMEKIELPPMKAASNYHCCVLSSSPPDCVVMFLYQEASCVFCRPKDKRWTRKILKPKYKEGSTKINYFASVCGATKCEGKIYISFMDGAGIKVPTPATDAAKNRSFTIDKIKMKENPDDSFDYFCTITRSIVYLVESCGEIFMVVKIYGQFSEDLPNVDVHTLNVFKLNYSSSSSTTGTAASASWEKVESLGDDRVFFLAQTCSVSVSASKLQEKENCIYFSEPEDEHLCAFDMEKSKFYTLLPCPHIVGRHIDEPSWMLFPNV